MVGRRVFGGVLNLLTIAIWWGWSPASRPGYSSRPTHNLEWLLRCYDPKYLYFEIEFRNGDAQQPRCVTILTSCAWELKQKLTAVEGHIKSSSRVKTCLQRLSIAKLWELGGSTGSSVNRRKKWTNCIPTSHPATQAMPKLDPTKNCELPHLMSLEELGLAGKVQQAHKNLPQLSDLFFPWWPC